jgi:hypothetical protein
MASAQAAPVAAPVAAAAPIAPVAASVAAAAPIAPIAAPIAAAPIAAAPIAAPVAAAIAAANAGQPANIVRTHTNNLWEIFRLTDIRDLLDVRTPGGPARKQAIIEAVNDEMENMMNTLEQSPSGKLHRTQIKLTAVNMRPTGLVVEFQYSDHAGRHKDMHATFHEDPNSRNPRNRRNSPSHLQFDVPPRDRRMMQRIQSMGNDRWIDLSILYDYDTVTNLSTSVEINVLSYSPDIRRWRHDLADEQFDIGHSDHNIIKIVFAGLSELLNQFHILTPRRQVIRNKIMTAPIHNILNPMDTQLFPRGQEKYLKYKQKYLELKKLLQNMNIN